METEVLPFMMEDNKNVYKYLGKPGEDFYLWAARTEAALESKDVLHVVTSDVLSQEGERMDEMKRCIATVRAILIQGMGSRPLRLWLSAKDSPYRMWVKLKERYAVSNTATKVQIQSKVARLVYKRHPMQDYIYTFEELFNHLASMKSDIPEDLQVGMVLASFCHNNKSSFGHVIASMQSVHDNLDWETTTARLL